MIELKKVTRWWWSWDYLSEEEWLNSMAQQGYTLVKVKWINYWFSKTEPGEYIIRLEYHQPDQDYISFMEDLGAEYISGYMEWNYYRRKSALGPFEMFSDLDSKITHCKRIEKTLLIFLILEIWGSFFNALVSSLLKSSAAVSNLWSSFFCVIIAMLLAYGYGCLTTRRKELEREKRLKE